jgi:hypothetical protein
MSEQLFSLVQALNKGEKRYFRAFAQRHVIGEQNLYERLFDVLLEMSAYDDAQLKRAFAGEKCLDQWASFKSYLYKLLRRSLRAYHEEGSVATEMHQLLRDLSILFGKSQFDACSRLLHKGKKLASEQESHGMMLDFLEWERRLIKRCKQGDLGKHLGRVAEAEQDYLERLRLEKFLTQQYDRIYSYSQQRKPQESATEVADLLLEMEAKITGHTLPFNAQIALGGIRGMVATHLDNLEEASLHFREVVLLWQSRPKIVAEHRERYLLTVANFLNTMYQVQNDAQFQQAIDLARSGHALQDNVQRFVRIMTGNLELLHHMNAGRYEEAERIVPMIGEIIKEEPEFLRPTHIITYSYNVCMLLFVRRRYRESVEWMNRILDFPGADTRIDIRNATQLLSLIVHYELGNDDLLDYLLAAALRKYHQDKPLFPMGSLVASSLRAAIHAANPTLRRQQITQLAARYAALPPDTARLELGYVEVGLWLEAAVGKR